MEENCKHFGELASSFLMAHQHTKGHFVPRMF